MFAAVCSSGQEQALSVHAVSRQLSVSIILGQKLFGYQALKHYFPSCLFWPRKDRLPSWGLKVTVKKTEPSQTLNSSSDIFQGVVEGSGEGLIARAEALQSQKKTDPSENPRCGCGENPYAGPSLRDLLLLSVIIEDNFEG